MLVTVVQVFRNVKREIKRATDTEVRKSSFYVQKTENVSIAETEYIVYTETWKTVAR